MTHENIMEAIRKLEEEISTLKSAYEEHQHNDEDTPESTYDTLKNEGTPTKTDRFFEELRIELSIYESVITRGAGPTSITVRKGRKEERYKVITYICDDYDWVLRDSANNTVACLKTANYRWAAKIFAAAIVCNIDYCITDTHDSAPYASESNLAYITQNLPPSIKISHPDDLDPESTHAIVVDDKTHEAFPILRERSGDPAIPACWDSRDRRKDLYKALESAEEE